MKQTQLLVKKRSRGIGETLVALKIGNSYG